ncbi:MAG TPA: FAD-dependent oxidoreductase [Dehalococcoidia bacterium]|nr:FAD-dependent oxidoreductase [Dehalococcoidia bacterium]
MRRRTFLVGIAAAAAGAAAPREQAADVVIIGGGVGGVAAALAAARNGRSVILTEETDWIGGQLTAQAVPPDEHRYIEAFGATRAYREYRERVRDYYRRNYPLTAEARARWDLNPGQGGVSRLCHEPRVSLAVLREMLAPYVSAGRVRILLRHRAVAADAERDRVRVVEAEELGSGLKRTLAGAYFLDATELGDLLPLTKTEYVTGFESQKQTGEMHAPSDARPADMQAFTCCFAMDYIAGEDHTIDKPEEYGFWRDYVPALQPPWPGKLLSWTATHPITHEPRTHAFDPECDEHGSDGGLWTYRRIAARRNFAPGTYRGDMSAVNWPQNDYWLGNLIGVSEAEAAKHVRRAKQLSLSLLYWMQTEAPRPDGKAGWRGLRLRRDIVGTDDGLAKYPYIRESRRVAAEFTVLEQHVGTDARTKLTGKPPDQITAEHFADSVGVGSYRIDLHPSSGGDNYIDISSLPFEIPLGALVPRRVENLLAACKNLGVTHITNGCFRLHPVEWNIGESAGLAAAFCLGKKVTPRAVRNSKALLDEFQKEIQGQGVEIAWPKI